MNCITVEIKTQHLSSNQRSRDVVPLWVYFWSFKFVSRLDNQGITLALTLALTLENLKFSSTQNYST